MRRADDFFAALAKHEERDEERHAELMKFVGSTEEFKKTSEKNTEAMFAGIAKLTQLIGGTREKVAEEDGKSKNNQRWIQALIIFGSVIVGALATGFVEAHFHLIH